MNPTLRIGALALTAALLSSTAHAETRWPNWYLGLTGSVGFLQDSDVGGSGAGVNTGVNYDTYGWGGGASLGYMPRTAMAPFNNMRIEGEVFYHTNSIDNLDTTGGPAPGRGRVSAVSYMLNLYYDIPTHMSVTPYIGVGAGVSDISLSRNSGLGNTGESDTSFSYQGMAGLAFTPASIPDTEWTIGYRYLMAADPSYATAGGNVKIDYSLHNVEAGVKLRF